VQDAQDPSRLLIRGSNVTGSFVADAGPLGEIFAASTNKSVVVYDPGKSGLPASLVIPPNIVRLVAALWL
jgi:hypothetical protein